MRIGILATPCQVVGIEPPWRAAAAGERGRGRAFVGPVRLGGFRAARRAPVNSVAALPQTAPALFPACRPETAKSDASGLLKARPRPPLPLRYRW